jgi:hypothetical protein
MFCSLQFHALFWIQDDMMSVWVSQSWIQWSPQRFRKNSNLFVRSTWIKGRSLAYGVWVGSLKKKFLPPLERRQYTTQSTKTKTVALKTMDSMSFPLFVVLRFRVWFCDPELNKWHPDCHHWGRRICTRAARSSMLLRLHMCYRFVLLRMPSGKRAPTEVHSEDRHCNLNLPQGKVPLNLMTPTIHCHHVSC